MQQKPVQLSDYAELARRGRFLSASGRGERRRGDFWMKYCAETTKSSTQGLSGWWGKSDDEQELSGYSGSRGNLALLEKPVHKSLFFYSSWQSGLANTAGLRDIMEISISGQQQHDRSNKTKDRNSSYTSYCIILNVLTYSGHLPRTQRSHS